GVPVLFLIGAHDMIVPPTAVRAAHAAMPESRYVEIPDAGHSVYFEQPQAFNAAVRTFLQEVWPAAPSPK
ncbi:MAG: alpha/beta fold hydrolase, partial [Dehalococcoidia bacterium]